MRENMTATQKPSTIPPIAIEEDDLGEQPLQQTRWEPLHECGDYNNAFKWPGEFTVLMDSPEKMLALIRPGLDVSAGISLIAQFILYTGIIDEYLIYLSFAVDKRHEAQKEHWAFEIHEALEGVRNKIREARGRVCDFATPARVVKEYADVLEQVKNVLENPETGPGRMLEAMRGEETAQAFSDRFRSLYDWWHQTTSTLSTDPEHKNTTRNSTNSYRNEVIKNLQVAISSIELGNDAAALEFAETAVDLLRDEVKNDQIVD